MCSFHFELVILTTGCERRVLFSNAFLYACIQSPPKVLERRVQFRCFCCALSLRSKDVQMIDLNFSFYFLLFFYLDLLSNLEHSTESEPLHKYLGIACTTTWNVVKKKAAIVSNSHQTGRPKKATAVDDRNIVRAVKKNPNTSVADITNNLHRDCISIDRSM